jgi:hypothetical protein
MLQVILSSLSTHDIDTDAAWSQAHAAWWTFGTTLAATLIAIFAAYYAYRAWTTSQNQLELQQHMSIDQSMPIVTAQLVNPRVEHWGGNLEEGWLRLPSPAYGFEQIPVEELHNSQGRLSKRHRMVFTLFFENSSDIPAYVIVKQVSNSWQMDALSFVADSVGAFTIRPHNNREMQLYQLLEVAHREADIQSSYRVQISFTVSNMANQCIDTFSLDSGEVDFYMHGSSQGRPSNSGLYVNNPPHCSVTGEKTAVPQGDRQY